MTDFQSLVFYITSFSVSTFFIYLNSKKKIPWQIRGVFATVGVLIPTVISGLRGQSVGTDTPEYIRMYTEILGGYFTTPIEPVTTILANISGALSSSPWLFFSLFSLISTVFYYFALTKIDKRYTWFMWFLYLFIYFTFSFNIARQMAAVSILFYAIVCLVVSKNKKMFLFWSFIAACTHAVSAIAAILFYVFHKVNARKPLSKNKIIVSTLSLAAVLGVIAAIFERLISFMPLPIFQKVLDNANHGEASVNIANGLFYLSVTLAMFVLYNRIRRVSEGIAVFAIGLSIGSVLIFLDNYVAHAGRLAYFFVVPSLPVILYAILIWAKDIRKMIAFTIMVMAVVLFVITRYLGNGSDIIPYVPYYAISLTGALV